MVFANLTQIISYQLSFPKTPTAGVRKVIDLSAFANQSIMLQPVSKPTGRSTAICLSMTSLSRTGKPHRVLMDDRASDVKIRSTGQVCRTILPHPSNCASENSHPLYPGIGRKFQWS